LRKERKILLEEAVKVVGEILSNPDREKNPLGETFTKWKVWPLSDDTATGIYEKDITKKKVAVFFFWAANKWWRIVPTDGHCHGMMMFPAIKSMVELDNYDKDFDED